MTAADSWRALAACRGMGPGTFFPELGEDWRDAKAVCAGCPVRTQCLDDALDNYEHHGIWGGHSERERRRMRRKRRAIAANERRRNAA